MASPLDAVRRLSASSLNLLLTRAQFATVELAQARSQWLRWIALALAGALLVVLALIALSALLVIAAWERFGAWTLLVLAVLYGAAAYVVVQRLQRETRDAPPLFSETLAELAKDREAILGRGGDGEPK